MAEIVLGIATSHSPQLSTVPDIWADHAARDRRNPMLLGRDGEIHTYDELAERSDWRVDEALLTPQAWQRAYDRSQAAIDILSAELNRVSPDAVVVVGDDQEEMFLADNTPAFAIYWGEDVVEFAPGVEEQSAMPAGLRAALWAAHGDVSEKYPVPADLGRHIIEHLMVDEFDVAQLTRAPEDRSIGHAFTFVRRRLMRDAIYPLLPVAINAYYPPNQPTANRCYRFGQALRRAIETYPAPLRVAVVGSGGLSHFVVDEELDWRVLRGLQTRDVHSLTTLPRKHMRSGTSEILNWVAAGGALEHLSMELIDYIPGYRSPAGTGVGLAFAQWR
jgi:3-O-methylgallate 3,4-dioxygenase